MIAVYKDYNYMLDETKKSLPRCILCTGSGKDAGI